VARVTDSQRWIAECPFVLLVDRNVDELEGRMNATEHPSLREGDVIEFTLRGERRTAEVMIVSEDDQLLLDLFDGDRPVFARVGALAELAVYRPDAADLLVAA
jgi:hypothetical protein